MLAFWIGILAVLGLYLCLWLLYYETFNIRSGTPLDLLHVPEDSPYAPYRSRYEASLEYIRSRPAELITIQSFDGLELRGRYYAGTPGSPLRILFHGYRSAQAENDFCCGLSRICAGAFPCCWWISVARAAARGTPSPSGYWNG